MYSAMLAESLAAAGAQVRFLGLGTTDAIPAQSKVQWCAVSGERKGQLSAMFDTLPLAAALDSTNGYKTLLEEQLKRSWDAIVLDSYATGWALTRCVEYRESNPALRTRVIHVSHNHEAALWKHMAVEGRGSLAKRLALRQNFYKVRHLERKLVRSVDLLTAITDEDVLTLTESVKGRSALTLTPGYAGRVCAERRIDASVPRRVVLIGSFKWAPKQENLVRFVETAEPVLAQHDIGLDIVGEVPEELLAKLKPQCRATRFHGFVDDVAPILASARLAVVPELIGGGFKLKFLDYIFARVPVATLCQAAAGLADGLRSQMLVSDDLRALVETIVDNIDRVELLDTMQAQAFSCGQAFFRWEDRGRRLLEAIATQRSQAIFANPDSARRNALVIGG